MSWPPRTIPAEQRAKMSASAKLAYAEGRHVRVPNWSEAGVQRRVDAALIRIYTKIECELCGTWISSLHMNRHQRGKRCAKLRGELVSAGGTVQVRAQKTCRGGLRSSSLAPCNHHGPGAGCAKVPRARPIGGLDE